MLVNSEHTTRHYNNIQSLHARLNEHMWSRQQTMYDSKFIAWLDKEILKLSNEAYHLDQKVKGFEE